MSSAASPELQTALQRFGLTDFRKGQREVIDHVVAGNDCLCVMPTGGGKSLCYQLPSVVRKGLTIVVSPLIALMKDQVDTLVKRGISATLINSTLSLSEQNYRLERVAGGHYNLLYVAPERLRNQNFLEAIRSTPVQLLAIDEAHCISEWGHDFRPDYQRVGRFREALGGIQTIALTATATPRVRQDIVDSLKLKVAKHFVTGFARDNLYFGVSNVHSDREKDRKLLEFLDSKPGSGIIYAATRKRCESLVEMVAKEMRLSVGAYHAGLAPEQRKLIQEQFMQGDLEVIVATNAFGMGIDKPDLRYVVHYNMPGTIEAYYQEAGRAGRDGHSSQCVLLYSAQDRYVQEFFIENANPSKEVIKGVYDFLMTREEDPIELTAEQIKELMNAPASSEAVNSALQILGRTDVVERLEMAGGLAMVRIDSQLPTLVDLLPRDAKVKRSVLRTVEKAVGDRREEAVYINPRWLMKQLDMERDALSRHMRELASLPGFEYVPPFRGRAIHFRKKGVPFTELKIDHANLEARRRSDYEKLDQMVSFAQSRNCRQGTILHYFGDVNASDCKICDRCQGKAGWPKIPDDKKAPPVAPKTRSEITAPTGGDQALASAPAVSPPKTTPAKNTKEAPAASKQTSAPVKSAAPSGPIWSATEWEEARELVRKILAAIERTHGYLSKTILSQFLAGQDNRAIQGLRLQRLPEYGLLSHWKKTHVGAFLDRLLEVSLLLQTELKPTKVTLSVSPSGLECIHGISPIPDDIVELTCSNSNPAKSGATKSAGSKAKLNEEVPVASTPVTGTPVTGVVDEPAIQTQSTEKQSRGAAKKEPPKTAPRKMAPPVEALPRSGVEALPQSNAIDPPIAGQTSKPAAPVIVPDDPMPSPGLEDALGVRDPRVGTSQDWEWSLRLVLHGYRLGEVALIRGKHPDRLLMDLCDAMAAGRKVPIDQLFDKRTQIAIREVASSPHSVDPPLAFASFPKLWEFAREWARQK